MGVHRIIRKHEEGAFIFAGCAFDCSAAMGIALEHTDHGFAARFELFDHAGAPDAIPAFLDFTQRTIFDAGIRVTAFSARARIENVRTEQPVFANSLTDQLTIAIDPCEFDDACRRRGISSGKGAFTHP